MLGSRLVLHAIRHLAREWLAQAPQRSPCRLAGCVTDTHVPRVITEVGSHHVAPVALKDRGIDLEVKIGVGRAQFLQATQARSFRQPQVTAGRCLQHADDLRASRAFGLVA